MFFVEMTENTNKKEVKELVKATFDEWDTNKDGQLSAAEIRAMSSEFLEDMFGEPESGYSLEHLQTLDSDHREKVEEKRRQRLENDQQDDEEEEEGREPMTDEDGDGDDSDRHTEL